MGLLRYTTVALQNMGRASGTRIDSSTWKRLNDLGICASKTIRGCRAGKHKQQKISVRISERRYINGVVKIRSIDTSNLRAVPQDKDNVFSAPINTRKSLPSLFVCNPCSLNNKMDEFRTVVHDQKVDIAVISESWFKPNMPEEHVQIDGFSLFSRPRIGRLHGVALYARDSFHPQAMDIITPDHLETVWVHLRPSFLPRTISGLYCAAIYSPPGDPYGDALIDHLQQTVDQITTDHPDAGIVIAGDMNRLDIAQLTTGVFTQVVKEPTRQRAVLDKIITNISGHYQKPRILPPVGHSDHNTVQWQPLPKSKPHNEIKTTHVRPIPDSALREFGQWIVQHDWMEVRNEQNVQSKCNSMYATLNEKMDHHFPSSCVKLHCRDKPWMKSHIKSLIRKRQVLFQKGDLQWKSVRNKIIRLISKAKVNYYHHRVQNVKSSNPAGWYREIRVMTKGSKPTPSIIPPPGTDPANTQQVADSINHHFTSIAKDIPVLDMDNLPAYLPAPEPCPSLQEWDVFNQLRRINSRKAGGPDGIPARIIR